MLIKLTQEILRHHQFQQNWEVENPLSPDPVPNKDKQVMTFSKGIDPIFNSKFSSFHSHNLQKWCWDWINLQYDKNKYGRCHMTVWNLQIL